MTSEEIIRSLSDARAARAAALALDEPARELAEKVGADEAVEIFRRVAAREIKVGGFLTHVGEAVARADLENQFVLLPVLYRLLVKYETLLEQHRAKAPITTFPPPE